MISRLSPCLTHRSQCSCVVWSAGRVLLSVILGSIYDVTGTFNFDLNTWQSLIVSVPNLFARRGIC